MDGVASWGVLAAGASDMGGAAKGRGGGAGTIGGRRAQQVRCRVGGARACGGCGASWGWGRPQAPGGCGLCHGQSGSQEDFDSDTDTDTDTIFGATRWVDGFGVG